MFVVFDLDGTLADGEHRMHYISGEKKDWRAFFALCGDDKPIDAGIGVLQSLLLHGGHRVEIWTGRSDEVIDQTIGWFVEHIGSTLWAQVDRLRMRPAGDYTQDHDLKADWLAESERKPDLVFEDRDRVVAMWRANGVPCFQVAPGAF